MKKILKNIQHLIARGHLEQALKDMISSAPSLRSTFLLHSHRYHTVKRLFREGLVSLQDFQVELARIADALLAEVELLAQNHQGETSLKKI